MKCEKWIVFVFKVLEEQRRDVENQFSDRLADMDRQINEAKREHAKAGMITKRKILGT